MTVVDMPVSSEGLAGIAVVRAALSTRPRDETLTVAERRAAIVAATAASSKAIEVDHIILGQVAAERHGRDALGALLYAHGGAYVIGSAATHRAFAASIASAAQTTLYAVDYRLAPEHPFPAGCNDMVAAYQALLDRGEGPIALVGDSAGGGMVLQTAIALREAGLPMPRAIAVTSPWVDFACDGDSYISNATADTMLTHAGLIGDAARYLGSGAADNCGAWLLKASLDGLPPILIQVGQAEILLSDSERLSSKLSDEGVQVTLERWEAMTHAWHVFRDWLPEAEAATDCIGKFLRQALA